MIRQLATTATVTCMLMAPTWGADAVRLQPRILPGKPEHFELQPHHLDDVITVKFRDDLVVRVRDGVPTDFGSGVLADAGDALDLVAGAVWEPAYTLPDAKLDQLRRTAEGNLGRALADLRTQFNVFLPEGVDVVEAVDALNALDVVELAMPASIGPPAPLPPDFQPEQGDHAASPVGVDAYAPWEVLGARGAGVRLCIIDYYYNQTHQDLPAVTLLGSLPNQPPAPPDDEHGTACLGVLGAIDNGWGTTGLAPDAPLYFVAAAPQGFWNVAGAVITAIGTLQPGDVLLIEQQWFGPCSNPINPCWANNGNAQYGLVSVEWHPTVYNNILTAIGNGIIVVEAAGNGEQDFDNPVYDVDDVNSPNEVENHQPFDFDSGAIFVGAGAAPQQTFFGSDTDRSRLWYSNYGSRLDLQGWGERVPTTGYGNKYGIEGMDLFYVYFSGTSSAAAVVAGAAVVFQSAYQQSTGSVLTPAALRAALVSTGAAQQAGTFPVSQNIGPRPDVAGAILQTTNECLPQWDVTVGNPGLTFWTGQVDVPAYILAMTIFDDGSGSGPGLYVGGYLTTADGLPVNYVARYDGTGWSALGSGITQGEFGTNFAPRSMVVFDDGNGDALYVGGDFIGAGGITVNYIAKWDGTQWSALGTGMLGSVSAMAVYDDGNGPALYVGSRPNSAPCCLGKWDGTSWSAIGAGTALPFSNCSPIYDMEVYDDGNGTDLYLTGCFAGIGDVTDGSAAGIARWDGTQYSSVGGGLMSGIGQGGRDLIVHDDGSGSALYVGGDFTDATGFPANYVATWEGTQWSALGGEVNASVTALGVYDDGIGTGPDLYVGSSNSNFKSAGPKAVKGMAKWDGSEWWPVDAGVGDTVTVMADYDDGSGASLYVSGVIVEAGAMTTNSLARWVGCPPAPCPWDLGGDGSVGTGDLLALLSGWGSNPGHPADFNGDGVVGTADLLALLSNWGGCP